MEECICKFCGKPCKNLNSLRNHERLCKKNPNRQESSWIKFNHERGAWNKGLTKETDKRVKKCTETFSKRYGGTEEGKRIFSHPQSEEHKQKMRKIAFERHWGGWHTAKTYNYKDIKLDSSYEVTFAQDLDNNNIKWSRPNPLKWKDNNGNEHMYYPDFYIEDFNVYVDTKNDYLINNINPKFGITDCEKINLVMEQNSDIKIIILDKNQLSFNSLLKKL